MNRAGDGNRTRMTSLEDRCDRARPWRFIHACHGERGPENRYAHVTAARTSGKLVRIRLPRPGQYSLSADTATGGSALMTVILTGKTMPGAVGRASRTEGR